MPLFGAERGELYPVWVTNLLFPQHYCASTNCIVAWQPFCAKVLPIKGLAEDTGESVPSLLSGCVCCSAQCYGSFCCKWLVWWEKWIVISDSACCLQPNLMHKISSSWACISETDAQTIYRAAILIVKVRKQVWKTFCCQLTFFVSSHCGSFKAGKKPGLGGSRTCIHTVWWTGKQSARESPLNEGNLKDHFWCITTLVLFAEITKPQVPNMCVAQKC